MRPHGKFKSYISTFRKAMGNKLEKVLNHCEKLPLWKLPLFSFDHMTSVRLCDKLKKVSRGCWFQRAGREWKCLSCQWLLIKYLSSLICSNGISSQIPPKRIFSSNMVVAMIIKKGYSLTLLRLSITRNTLQLSFFFFFLFSFSSVL